MPPAGGYIWAQVNWMQVSATLGHKMPQLGVDLTKGQPDPKAAQMSGLPDVVLLLATRYHYQGVWLTKDQPDPKADQMSSWPDVILLLATRCHYQGVHLSSGQLDQS